METMRAVVAYVQSVQAVARNKMTRMRRHARLRSPHRTADRDDKRSQAGDASGDDDDVRFHAGKKSSSEVGAYGGDEGYAHTAHSKKSAERSGTSSISCQSDNLDLVADECAHLHGMSILRLNPLTL